MSSLEQLVLAAADALLAQPVFASVPVLVEATVPTDDGVAIRTTESALSEALNTVGVAVVLLQPEFDVSMKDVPGPFAECTVRGTVWFSAAFSAQVGRSTMQDFAEAAMATLHWLLPQETGFQFTPAEAAVRIRRVGPHWAADFALDSGRGLLLDIPQLTTPIITNLVDVVRIMFPAEPGGLVPSCFYTLDKSAPSPRNGSRYVGPFNVAGLAGTRPSEPELSSRGFLPVNTQS